MKVKVYEYEEDGVGCTDFVIESEGKIYPFLTEGLTLPITRFSDYGYYKLEGNLPENAILVKEYEVEE